MRQRRTKKETKKTIVQKRRKNGYNRKKYERRKR